jgi:hypothetical protein
MPRLCHQSPGSATCLGPRTDCRRDPHALDLAAGSFRDLTRLALSEPAWWPELLVINRGEVRRVFKTQNGVVVAQPPARRPDTDHRAGRFTFRWREAETHSLATPQNGAPLSAAPVMSSATISRLIEPPGYVSEGSNIWGGEVSGVLSVVDRIYQLSPKSSTTPLTPQSCPGPPLPGCRSGTC